MHGFGVVAFGAASVGCPLLLSVFFGLAVVVVVVVVVVVTIGQPGIL